VVKITSYFFLFLFIIRFYLFIKMGIEKIKYVNYKIKKKK
jgi:hypothetical protein